MEIRHTIDKQRDTIARRQTIIDVYLLGSVPYRVRQFCAYFCFPNVRPFSSSCKLLGGREVMSNIQPTMVELSAVQVLPDTCPAQK